MTSKTKSLVTEKVQTPLKFTQKKKPARRPVDVIRDKLIKTKKSLKK